jgi:RNA-dependent RNA polymerase
MPFISQTQELVRIIREDLRRVEVASYADETQSDDEEEEDEEEMDDFTRGEIFKRAWAAWKVADEALYDEPPVFGAQSFGLIALGVLLEIIKDASINS